MNGEKIVQKNAFELTPLPALSNGLLAQNPEQVLTYENEINRQTRKQLFCRSSLWKLDDI